MLLLLIYKSAKAPQLYNTSCFSIKLETLLRFLLVQALSFDDTLYIYVLIYMLCITTLIPHQPQTQSLTNQTHNTFIKFLTLLQNIHQHLSQRAQTQLLLLL